MQNRSYLSRTVLALLVVLVFSPSARGQCGGAGLNFPTSNNAGNEFLLCFEQDATLSDTDPGYQDIFLASTGDSAHVTITCRAFPLYSKLIVLPPGGSTSYRVSDDIDPILLTSEFVDSRVVRVSSTSPIICYGMNHKQFSADAFLALPRNVATTDYRVMAYTNTPGSGPGDETQSQFAVAAFSNGTHVTITPSAQTLGGSVAGKPITFTIDSAECVQIQGDPLRNGEDMTASIVTSDKPVAVFGGQVCGEVPVGYMPPGASSSSCDHLTEMMQPTSTWGEAFVATNFAPRSGGDILRVEALNDNTTIKVNGQIWGGPLSKSQYRDTLIESAVTIETSGPAQVGEFAHTAFDQTATNGDPFFAIVPPVNQTYSDFTFFSSEDPVYTTQFVVVVTTQNTKTAIYLDGSLIPSSSFSDLATQLGGLDYSIATIGVQPGSHHITTKNDNQHGFTILAYGFGLFDSYGYTAGALLRPLRGALLTKAPSAGTIENRKPQTTIDLRNILNTRVYLDSASVQLSPRDAKLYTAKVRENVAMDISYLDVGQGIPLHIDVTPPNESPLDAVVRVYTHAAQWLDFKPTESPIVIQAAGASGVESIQSQGSLVTAYPNPFTSSVTLSFSLQKRADVSLNVYDDLGRLVKQMVNETMSSGDYALRFSAFGLPAGHYYYELRSQALGMHERGSLTLL